MKILKFGLLPVLLLAVVALFAFTPKASTGTTSTEEFFYFLKPGGDPLVEEDYTTREEMQPPSCGGDDAICWIKATDNGNGEPAIDVALATEISAALTGHADSDNVKLKD